jgi:prepilin-type N-terminal cleavage/methylation domain-containing protein
MKRAFTLIELLVVIAIMALLGGITVSGYRQMKRGMEERGTLQNANQFIRSAYQRAQIDRQPVAVYFWNETIRGRTSEEYEIVVGRAIAIRRAGRLTRVTGNYLYDEFGDLKFNTKNLDEDEEGLENQSSSEGGGINFYKINGDEGNTPAKSIVYEITKR